MPVNNENENPIFPTVSKEMKEYAKYQMVQLLQNISRQPVEVYSQKVRGKEKEYFFSRTWIENLIKQISQT